MHGLLNLKICIAKQAKQIFHYERNLILCNLYKKIVYQVGINKGIIKYSLHLTVLQSRYISTHSTPHVKHCSYERKTYISPANNSPCIVLCRCGTTIYLPSDCL